MGRTFPSLMMDQWCSQFASDRIDVTAGTLEQYRIAASAFASACPGMPTKESVVTWLRSLRDRGLSPRTINNKRQALLTLWRWAYSHGLTKQQAPDIPKLKEHKPLPLAWSVDELSLILRACRQAPTIQNWTPRHWESLTCTIYDTSTRISALLLTERSSLSRDGVLTIKAEHQKQNRPSIHRLHPDTASLLHSLPPHRLLFPWPFRKRAIWRHFRRILISAGLPATRRDLFHKLRRTSYTQVYDHLGPEAARLHAGHMTDLSAIYYDPRSKIEDVAERIPRPSMQSAPPPSG